MQFSEKVNNLITDVSAGKHKPCMNKWVSAQFYVKERGDKMTYGNIVKAYAMREIIRQENGPEEIFL